MTIFNIEANQIESLQCHFLTLANKRQSILYRFFIENYHSLFLNLFNKGMNKLTLRNQEKVNSQ